MTLVDGASEVVLVDRGVEAWPAGTRIELVIGRKEWQAAHHAAVRAVLLVVQQRSTECSLGPVLLSDLELFRSELGCEFSTLLITDWRDVITTLRVDRLHGTVHL